MSTISSKLASSLSDYPAQNRFLPLNSSVSTPHPAPSSSLTQRVLSREFLGGAIRHKRQLSNEESRTLGTAPFQNRSDPVSPEQKKRILTMLHQRMVKMQSVSHSALFSTRQKEILAQAKMPLLTLNFAAIRRVQSATTLQQICQILETLNQQLSRHFEPFLSIALPPLATEFENQVTSLWINGMQSITGLQKIGLEKMLSDADRRTILTRIREQGAQIDRFKILPTGNLSEGSVRQLQLGFDKRKNDLSQADESIQNSRKNQEASNTLSKLGRVIAKDAQNFQSILASPQRLYLQKQIFSISVELLTLLRELCPGCPSDAMSS